MALKNYPLAVTTSASTIYTCPSGLEASVHGLVISNITTSDATVNITYYKSTWATTYNLGTNITVSANKTFSWPRPINMTAGDYIQITASANSTLVADASVYEGSTVTYGFNVTGDWNSSTTYAANDVVAYSGSSWAAIQASTNQAPVGGSAYWMKLANDGGSGGGVGYTFSTTTTDADPGTGFLRFNNATVGSVTQLFISNSDTNTNTVSAWLDSFSASTNTIKGTIIIRSATSTGTALAIFSVNGSVTSATGYRKIPVAYVAGAIPSNNATIVVSFSRAGDVGTNGTNGSTGPQGPMGPKGLSILNPGAAENVTLFYTNASLTINEVRNVVAGTTPSVTFALVSGSDRTTVTTTHVSSVAVTNTTTGATQTIANATIPSGVWVWITTSATSGTVTRFDTVINFT